MFARRIDPVLPSQVGGILTITGVEWFTQAQLDPSTPLWARAIAIGFWIAMMALWSFQVPFVVRAFRHRRLREADRRLVGVLAFGSFAYVAQVFCLFPWLSSDMRAAVLVFGVGVVGITAFATIERPPVERPPSWMPLIVPGGLIAWYLMHPSPIHVALALLIAVFTGVILYMRHTLQQQVNRTHRAMLKVEAAHADLSAQREARERFVAAAWHDLGQPIQAARLFADQSWRASSVEARRLAAANADAAFETIERQLRLMLKQFRAETATHQPAVSRQSAGGLIAEAVTLHSGAARRAGVTLISMPSSRQVRADPDLAGRALGNLIDNALRHAHARRVLVGALRRGRVVQLWVIDDGDGIDPNDAPRLFEDFAQGRSKDAGQGSGGFGVGLGSASRIARLLGGDLIHAPRWRMGAAFCLELPLA